MPKDIPKMLKVLTRKTVGFVDVIQNFGILFCRFTLVIK